MKQAFILLLLTLTIMIVCQDKPYVIDKDLLKISDNGIIYGSFYDHNNFGFKNVIIPDTIDGKEIIGIESLGSIPNTIEKISLPKALRYLGYYLFKNQPMDDIELPDSLIILDAGALNFKRLSQIVLPNPTLKDHHFIGWNDSILGFSTVSFGNKENYEISFKAKFRYQNEKAYSIDFKDVLLNRNCIKKCYYSGSSNIAIPYLMNGIKIVEIGERSFSNKNIISVEIDDNIVIIDEGAFVNNQIKDLSLPNKLKKIGKFSFSRNRIKNLKLPSNIRHLGMGCFENNFIKELVIPLSVDSILSRAFANNQLKEINIPDSIIYIGTRAFYGNELLIENIPTLHFPKIKGKTFLYWQSFKKGKYIRETKSFEEIPVAKCQPGDKMDLELGYKAVFKEDL